MEMTNEKTQPLMMTAREVAEALAVSERCLASWIDSGQVPRPRRIGGARRWVRRELHAWIADGCHPVDPPKRRAGA